MLKKVIILFWLITSQSILAQESSELGVGIINNLKKIVDVSRESLQKEYQSLISSGKIEQKPTQEQIESSRISPSFQRSIFLHSPKKYLELVNLNECHLYSLLENGLLRSALGEIDYLILKGKQGTFLVSPEQYAQQTYKFKCKKFAQLSNIFDSENLKSTISNISFPIPKTSQDCSEIHKDWLKNDYIPFLCKIPYSLDRAQRAERAKKGLKNSDLRRIRTLNNIIREADYYKKEVSFFKRTYLKNLCDDISSKENFCKTYLAQDSWTKVLNGELPKDYISYSCKTLYKKSFNIPLSEAQLMKCAKRLKESPELCLFKSHRGYSSLVPSPNCSLSSKALVESRLYTDYKDCPGQIDNASITNIHRLVQHFKKRPLDNNKSSCQAEANKTLFNLIIDGKNEDQWPLKICYDDKIEAKELCHSYIPGSLEASPISENKIITKVLRRLTSISSKSTCSIIPKSKYNPVLLEYKNGCFITFDENNCSNAHCPKKIIVDEKEVTGLRFNGKLKFDYFPNNWKDQKKSAFSMIKESYKIEMKRLRNLTELEVFLKLNPKGIIHGVGCVEDIIPQHFKRVLFNQCTPMPFISDGIVSEDGNKVIVTRTALDDLHSPRLIPWNWIFTAIMKYKEHHPLGQWNLYGAK